MVKLGAYKNCKKRLMRYGLSEKEAELGCARYLDDEWSVKAAAALGKTGFEVENPVEEPAQAFKIKKPKERQTSKVFALTGPEEITYRSTSFWKGWTPAGGKGAGRLEPEARRPEKATPLSAQMPLFQPWRSQKSQHRLQTKLEKVQTEEQKYLTQEQLAKRTAYAVSIKKKDSGDLEITLPAIILDEGLKMPTFEIKGAGGKMQAPKIVQGPDGSKGFWVGGRNNAKFISIEAKGKEGGGGKQETPKGKKGKPEPDPTKSYEQQQKFPKNPINEVPDHIMARSERLRKAMGDPKIHKPLASLGIKEEKGGSGEQYLRGKPTQRKIEKLTEKAAKTQASKETTRIEAYLKEVHSYPGERAGKPEQLRSKDPFRGIGYTAPTTKAYEKLETAIEEEPAIESMSVSQLTAILTNSKRNLVHQEEAAKNLKSPREMIDILQGKHLKNHHIREILVTNLRELAGVYDPDTESYVGGDPVAAEEMKKIDYARRLNTPEDLPNDPDKWGELYAKTGTTERRKRRIGGQGNQETTAQGKARLEKDRLKVAKERLKLEKSSTMRSTKKAPFQKPVNMMTKGPVSKERLLQVFPSGKTTTKPKAVEPLREVQTPQELRQTKWEGIREQYKKERQEARSKKIEERLRLMRIALNE